MAAKKNIDPLSPDVCFDLDDVDYASIGLRPRSVKPLPPSKPFDEYDAFALIEKAQRTTYAWVDFGKTPLSPSMRRDETNLWLRAMLSKSYNAVAVLKELKAVPSFTQEIPNLAAELSGMHFRTPIEAAVPLFASMGLPGMLAWMNGLASQHCRYRLIEGLREYVLPYVSDGDLAIAKSIVLGWLRRDPISLPDTPGQDVMVLAAELQMRDEVRDRLSIIKPLVYFAADRRDIILRLGDVDRLLAELARKDCVIDTPVLVRQCLALGGVRVIDPLVEFVLREPSKPKAEALAKALARARAPEMAHSMLRLMQAGVAAHVARGWFTDNPARAAMGLANSTQTGAREILAELCRQGYGEVVRQFAPVGDIDTAPPTASILPAELEVALPQVGRPHPTDPPISSLPPIQIDGAAIGAAAIAPIFEAMRKSTLEYPHPSITVLGQLADPRSLDSFAIVLLRTWIDDGMPAASRWRMTGASLTGGDGFVLELGARILEWPGQSGHARSVAGLQCLLAVGSDQAFSQLALIAEKSKFEGLKKKAMETMSALAEARGLTVDQLEDRVVPRCGLDTAARYFDFGVSRFQLVLSPELKPMLKDNSGFVSSEFPKPRADDDPDTVARAKADWAIVKKQAAQIAKVQAERLERAMVRGRRWSAYDFMTYIVGHPILSLLAQRVIWAAYGESDPSAFRVTEDFTLADVDDIPIILPDGVEVGIPHPVTLPEGERRAWGELLSDYEIVPPFRQLTREIHLLTEDEQAADNLTRLRGEPMDGAAQKILRHKHWRLVGDEYRKTFEAQNATVLMTVGQGWWSANSPAYQVDSCFVYAGLHVEDDLRRIDRLKWSEVDPVVPSEVLRDLHGALKRS